MMDSLHSVLRQIRGETKSRRDHLTVFREFLHHLDRAARASPRRTKSPGKGRAPKPRSGRRV